MPCPSGAGQLAIYLGSAHDTNRLPATTLGKIYWKYTGEKHWKRVGKTAKYLGSAEERTPTKWLAGWPCLKICTNIVCTLTFLAQKCWDLHFCNVDHIFCESLPAALFNPSAHSEVSSITFFEDNWGQKANHSLIDEAASHCPRFFGWPFNLTSQRPLSSWEHQLMTSCWLLHYCEKRM